jgi:AcrB/AcrD/AcrF family protein
MHGRGLHRSKRLSSGSAAQLRQPLGYTIVGGLAVSQILTLFTTPIVYLYLDRLGTWLQRHRGGHSPVAKKAVS